MSDIAITEIVPSKTIVLDDEAYRAYPGPVLLLAGPGTGKTYQLAKRIQFLTSGEMKVGRDEITVITFTKEAAQSMRDKISQKNKAEYVPEEMRPRSILTMHSLAQTIIAENLGKVNLKENFVLVESDGLKRILMTDAAFLLGFSESDAKRAIEDRGQAIKNCSEESTAIIEKYEQLLRRSNAIDYDDQIILACKLLEDSNIQKKWAQRSKHLLIDEYQDINEDQYRFISLLVGGQKEGLFVVGDDDQSIYKFRGGSPEYIRKFDEHFGPNAKLLQLETSRRCLKNILDCANHLVSVHDAERMPKADPKYHKTEAGQVIVHDCPSDDKEAKIIASIIKDDIENAKDFRSIFILTLTKNYSKKIEEMLASYRLNYDGPRRKNDSIDKFLDIQAWIKQTRSNILLRQAIQLVVDGGSTTVPGPKSKTAAKQSERHASLTKIAALWEEVLQTDNSLLHVLEKKAATDVLCQDTLTKLNILAENYDKDLAGFLKLMVDYIKPWATKDGFYQDMSDFMKASRPKPGGQYQIRILSLQASKGLEADLVFVIGLEEGSMPKGKTAAEVAEDAQAHICSYDTSQRTTTLNALQKERRVRHIQETISCSKVFEFHKQPTQR